MSYQAASSNPLGPSTSGTFKPLDGDDVKDAPSVTRPSAVVEKRQERDYSEANFAADLERVSRRSESS